MTSVILILLNLGQYKYVHEIQLVFLYQYFCEVVVLKMPSRNRKKRAKQQAEYLQKRDTSHQKKTRLNVSAL